MIRFFLIIFLFSLLNNIYADRYVDGNASIFNQGKQPWTILSKSKSIIIDHSQSSAPVTISAGGQIPITYKNSSLWCLYGCYVGDCEVTDYKGKKKLISVTYNSGSLGSSYSFGFFRDIEETIKINYVGDITIYKDSWA